VRILVTGSRDWEDEDRLVEALFDSLGLYSDDWRDAVLVHGDCPTGADYLAWMNWTASGFFDEPHTRPRVCPVSPRTLNPRIKLGSPRVLWVS